MNEESLVRICTTSFSAIKNDSSKSLLLESVPTSKKQNKQKERRSLDETLI